MLLHLCHFACERNDKHIEKRNGEVETSKSRLLRSCEIRLQKKKGKGKRTKRRLSDEKFNFYDLKENVQIRLSYRSTHEIITCIMLFICRDFLFYVSAPKIRATNPQCSLKTEVVCDRSKPTVTFSLRKYNNKSMELFASSFQCIPLSFNSFT